MPAPGSIFHRAALAQSLADKILNVALGSAASSGVFLAAPRRTGKSTIVREDLRPAGRLGCPGPVRGSVGQPHRQPGPGD